MRAMILAAGLGTRLSPLSNLRAKPALPVRGRPVIACLLEWLARHGVREVLVNLYHLPDTIERAVNDHRPHDLRVYYSRETRPLGTGGGIRRAASFLRESDPALVLAGDMLLDVDLAALLDRHRHNAPLCTLLLREDRRSSRFGSIGIDGEDRVRRIADSFDLGGASRAGLFVGLRLFSRVAFATMPAGEEPFEDLRDWLVPALQRDESCVRGCLLSEHDCVWEPVGTPREYLRANLQPPALSYLPARGAWAPGTQVIGADADVIVGRGASIEAGARLERSVVWEEEHVGREISGAGGVFAEGKFYPCEAPRLAGNTKTES